MNDIKENNTGYKLSRADFEVEKLKLQESKQQLT